MNQTAQTEVSTSVPSRCHAIVIGIDEYLTGIKPLNGCVNDAKAMYDFLVDKVHIATNQLTLLTSPASNPKQLATAENIRAAFAALINNNAIRKDDHVILFYACHGWRGVPKIDTATVRCYGLVAADSNAKDGHLVLDNKTILDGEINGFLRALQRRSVSATVIADTCHSGASTRDIGESDSAARCIEVRPMSDNDWADFQANHPALGQHASRDLGDAISRERVGRNLDPDADFVVLAACQDTEEALELKEKDELGRIIRRGALTSKLLAKLERMPPEEVESLCWTHFFDNLREEVHELVLHKERKRQTPALEGKPERRVFGGQWRPFARGFTAIKEGDDYVVKAGRVHGLDVGAKLDLYPWETYDYKDSAVAHVHAEIIEVTASTSTLKLVDAKTFVGPKMRARLVKQNKAMQVRFRDMPPEILNAAGVDALEFTNFVAVAGQNAPAHVEVRPFTGEIPVAAWDMQNEKNRREFQGARDGWVFVRSDKNGEPGSLHSGFKPAPEDILAYLPGAGPLIDGLSTSEKNQRLGNALQEGLIHYARYLHIRDRKGGDETLRNMLSVKLLVGDGAEWPEQLERTLRLERIKAMQRIDPDKDGVYSIQDDQCSFLEVQVLESPGLRLFMGVLLCSDDGNIIAAWPPEGQRYTFEGGSTTYIGQDRFNPQFLNRRQDQQISYWSLELFAYTAEDDHSINLQSLEQNAVQDVFAKWLDNSRAVAGRRSLAEKPEPSHYVWSFRMKLSDASNNL